MSQPLKILAIISFVTLLAALIYAGYRARQPGDDDDRDW